MGGLVTLRLCQRSFVRGYPLCLLATGGCRSCITPLFRDLTVYYRFNRDDFLQNMNNALRRRDVLKIKDYYSRSPSSGIFILEYGDRFIGLIAVDASQDSTSNEVIVTAESKAKVSFSKGTSDVATIRHFFVEEPYRAVNMQSDLLHFALGQVFQTNSRVKIVKAVESPLIPYVGKVLHQVGFKVEGDLDRTGALRWKRKVMVIDRQTWEKRAKSN